MGNLKRRVIAIFIAVSFLLTSISVIAITPAGQESTHGTGSGIPEASMSPVSVTPSGVLYNVTFTVSGLPLNEVWFATLNGSQKDNVVNHSPFYADNISFSIAPGLYNYSITTYTNFLTTYTPSPETGTVNVIDRNISVNITYKPSPMIPWAFNGSYANYSISQQTSGGTEYGHSFYEIYGVNESIGYFGYYFDRVIGSTYYNSTGSDFLTSYGWQLPNPLLRIPYTSLLSEFNAGNNSLQSFIIEQFINPHSSITIANVTFRAGVLVHTDIGSFATDELSAVYRYFNGTGIPGSEFHAYFDQHSGMLLKYVSILNGNYTEELQSTNIPMSDHGSRLVIHVSTPGAEVSINGIALNLTSGNKTVFMSPGTYYMSVSGQDHVPVLRKVVLTTGSTIYENISLVVSKTTTFTISGHVNPADSSVMVGNYVAYVNSLGNYSISLPSGSYTMSATANGYYPLSHSLNLEKNITAVNFSLAREPVPTSNYVSGNITAEGFNVTVTTLSMSNGNISLHYNATSNGSLVVEVPYYDLSSYTLSDILNSRLYINGTQYTNFTVTISAQGGNYAVVLSVRGLSKDPNLLWTFTPSKSPQGTIFGINTTLLEMISAVVVAVVAALTVVSLYRRKHH